MPKLLIFSRYDELGASSRLRMLQFIGGLASEDWEVHKSSLLNAQYLDAVYRNDRRLLARVRLAALILRAYLRRFRQLLKVKSFDLVWLEKELFPYLPGKFEAVLGRSGIPYIVDFDDAVFHNYDCNHSLFIRRLLGQKFNDLLKNAKAVTAGNDYLAEYALNHGAPRVEYIPTVINLAKYEVVPEPNENVFRIGWIGSPSTTQYLPLVFGALQRLAKKREIVFVTVGALPIDIPGVRVERIEWSLESEIRAIQSFHVGIMPLFSTPWELGKCGFKLIQYMACGRPVIASPVGVNNDIVTASIGRLAATEDEWLEALEFMASSRKIRRAMGMEARKIVESTYCTDIVAPKLARLFKAQLESAG